jgi:Na+/H+ antiporter NhaD/arsenite permease-like protein
MLSTDEASTLQSAADWPPLTAIPFVVLILSIALVPRFFPVWWSSDWNKGLVAGGPALVLVLYLVFFEGEFGVGQLLHSLEDYASFIVLLGALFVIAGGIVIEGTFRGGPGSNTLLLVVGAMMASLVGTTGASMILIRPLLRANAWRRRRAHQVIFFIFMVSNTGGLLTAVGDPPLFLGYLKGVPFFWTLVNLWRHWLFVTLTLAFLFFLLDRFWLRSEKGTPPSPTAGRFRVYGWRSAFFLGGLVVSILLKGKGVGTASGQWPFGFHEALMLILAAAAFLTTPQLMHEKNGFSMEPIREVAILFAGLFTTMAAPVLLLNQKSEALGLETPVHYFWSTGVLSSWLDNAPTYLTFAGAAAGHFGVSAAAPRFLKDLLATGPEAVPYLAAVSCGAVFMGAYTYIGNGPNFMVKAIAEQSGVAMPSFIGYLGYSVPILTPLFLILSLEWSL